MREGVNISHYGLVSRVLEGKGGGDAGSVGWKRRPRFNSLLHCSA